MDRRLQGTIERWRTIVRDTLRALEDWRDAPDFYFEDPPALSMDFAFEPRPRNEATIQSLRSCTTELNRVALDLPLDPRPLQEVFDVVALWNRTLVADQIPDQRRVRAIFDAAFLVVDTVEARILQDVVEEQPEPAPQPVAPVVVEVSEPDFEWIDDRELAQELRAGRASVLARIVELMAGKAQADYQELEDKLYPDEDTSDQRIRTRVNSLIRKAEGLRAKSVYSQGQGHIYRTERSQTPANS